MNLKDLANPFAPEDIEWRMQQSGTNKKGPWGKCLAYVTNRAIMDRLDAVCGPEGWKNEFTKAPDGGILCGLSIGCKNVGSVTEWVTKWDGAQNTDVEAVKGGLSNAMKRAAVQWGIGRYLYNLETGWADFNTNGKYSAKMKDGSYHKWNPPQLPAWALPKATMTIEQSNRLISLCEKEGLIQTEIGKAYTINKHISAEEFELNYSLILADIKENSVPSFLRKEK